MAVATYGVQKWRDFAEIHLCSQKCFRIPPLINGGDHYCLSVSLLAQGLLTYDYICTIDIPVLVHNSVCVGLVAES